MRTRIRLTAALAAALVAPFTLASTGVETECELPTREDDRAGATRCRLELVGALDLATPGGTGQMASHGDLVAVVARDAGVVHLVDLTDPAAPVALGSYDGGTGQERLDHPLDGDVAFSDDGTILFHARQTNDYSNEGLHVLDVSDPAAPVLTDIALQGGMLRVAYARLGDGTEVVVTQDAIGGTTLFEVARTALGARVVPVWLDPLPELKVGGPASAGIVIEPEDPATGLPLLYVSDGTTGLRVLDISDPSEPVLLGAWEEQGLAELSVVRIDDRTLVRAAAEYWFTASTPPEIITLDVTDPTAITEVRRVNLGDFDGELAWKIGGMDETGSLRYVAHGHAGLVALDDADRVLRAATDLGAPEVADGAYADYGWYAMDVLRHGDLVLVTDAVTGELRVFAEVDDEDEDDAAA